MTDLNIPDFLKRADKPAPSGHLRFSASSAYRWLNCHGSVRLIESLNLPSETNVYMAEGTFAHGIAAKCLENGSDAWEHAGEEGEVEGFPFVCDDEMVASIQTYLDAVRAVEGELKVEVGGHLGEGFEDCGGTSDAVISRPGKVSVFDLKYGAGIGVEPEDNPQLMIYAAVATQEVSAKNSAVILGIIQPRKPHPKGPVRTWSYNLTQLRGWVKKTLKPAIVAARKPDAPLAVGDWCRWCPAFEHCPEQRARTKTIIAQVKDETAPPIEVMEPWEMGELLDLWPLVQQYFKNLSERSFELMLKGTKIPGQKLVAGRASRVWKDEAEKMARAAFGDAALSEPTFLSPAQIEKLGADGKRFAAEWAHKVPGRLTTAKESDPRAEVTPDQSDPAATFGDMV